VTEDQIRALLATAMAYDNRRPGDANVAAWQEAATRARWTFDEAVEAIHAHYATSTDFLMPGHITDRVRASRRQPAPYRPQLEAAAPASEETRARVMAMVGEKFALPTDVKRLGRDRKELA
jgi:hypothetical protein